MSRILIIEDNLEIRENLEELLELEGYQVETAADGQYGIEAANAHWPDLIICDISMPRKDGYQVFEALSASIAERQTPFIFLTASAQESDLARGRVSGATAYLTKPYQPDEFLQYLASLL